jgi:membrane peptidoglycan carboxypeptidase
MEIVTKREEDSPPAISPFKIFTARFLAFLKLAFYLMLVLMFLIELMPIIFGFWILKPVIDARSKILNLADSSSAVEVLGFDKPTRTWEYTKLEDFNPKLAQTLVAAEDGRFYQHGGVDVNALISILEESQNVREARFRGGSTITMQLARTLFLTNQRSYLRKFREILIALMLEEYLLKESILELYLNYVDWGDDLVGARDASLKYFNREPKRLALSECVYLVSLLPNPHLFAKPEGLRRLSIQKKITWTQLLNNKKITREDYCGAIGGSKIAAPVCGLIPLSQNGNSDNEKDLPQDLGEVELSPEDAPAAAVDETAETETAPAPPAAPVGVAAPAEAVISPAAEQPVAEPTASP